MIFVGKPMKKYLFAALSGLVLTGCATLEPVYEKLNAQVSAFQNMLGVSSAQNSDSDNDYFFLTYLLCGEKGSQSHVEVFFSDSFDIPGKKVSAKPGMIGMQWDAEKPVWTKPERLSENSFRLVFPGKKPMVITQTRVRKIYPDRSDFLLKDAKHQEAYYKDQYDPYIAIRFEKGKTLECSESFN